MVSHDSLFGNLGRTFGVIAVAFGMGVAGAYLLDWHKHACPSCGRRWGHLGAFSFGDDNSHRCPDCGKTQWWREGERGRGDAPAATASPTVTIAVSPAPTPIALPPLPPPPPPACGP